MNTALPQKGHPRGLYVLFFTEMWERFGYYLMVGILYLFLHGMVSNGGRGLDTKYEFGSKVSIITTKNSGVIIGVLNILKNDYDAHTVDPAFEQRQRQRLTGNILKRAFMDRGYKGITHVRGTKIEIPKLFKKSTNGYQQK